jgi:hypothetical protein
VSRSKCAIRLASPDRKSRSPGFWLAAVGLLVGAAAAQAASVSPNTGSLGPSANGTNADSVTFGPGAVSAGGDPSAVYTGATGSNTFIGYHSGLNPASGSPFTVEYWARPTMWDDDDAPVSNRVGSGDRSGWVFFQRDQNVGWNFRMYNGVGSTVGWSLTGGTSTLNSWSHVVATWDGTAARLYVNGVLADDTNAEGGGYRANPAPAPPDLGPNFLVASSDTGSPYTGSVDEVAFYGSVLSPAQIQNHFNTATTGAAGAYHSLVRSDGALLQLTNIPEPSAVGLLGAGAALLLRRRASRRHG